MTGIAYVIGLISICLGFFLLILLQRQRKVIGVLDQEKIYIDDDKQAGEILEEKTLRLKGKPDYIIRQNNQYIPVEVKTGRTPSTPYTNHVMQLMAYCLLVEHTYNSRPPGGIIKYPEKEFKVAYTMEAENSIKTLIKEILEAKKSGSELSCSHPEHNK